MSAVLWPLGMSSTSFDGRIPPARRCHRVVQTWWIHCTSGSQWELAGSLFPVETTVDSVGRLVVPKALRDALGLKTGAKVDVTLYGAGLHVVPSGRTARLVEADGRLVAESETVVTDEMVFGLLGASRR